MHFLKLLKASDDENLSGTEIACRCVLPLRLRLPRTFHVHWSLRWGARCEASCAKSWFSPESLSRSTRSADEEESSCRTATLQSNSAGINRPGGVMNIQFSLAFLPGFIRFNLSAKRNDARNQPLVPHLVNLALEVFDVFVDEVGESSLLEQIVSHRQALELSIGNFFSFAVELQNAVLNLIQRPDASVHGQFAQLEGEDGIKIPTFRTGVKAVNKGRPADRQRLADAVHCLQRI